MDHSDLHAAVVTAARSRGAQMQDLREYRSSSSALTVRNGVLQGAGGSISDAVQFTAIPLSDYNAAMGARLTLSPGQVYICHGRSDYRESTLSFPGGAAWQVKGLVDNLASGGDSASVVTQLTAIVPDEEIADMDRLMEGMNTGVSRSWSCGFDLGQEPARDEGDPVAAAIREALVSRQDDIRFNVESLSENRGDFYGSYGSLFFLGILLSVGFSLAAVLIIYYKQISEGYEDQARFDIMQKVGMTRRDIRSSINSQLLLVFFLPLLLAGLHLVFAFPFVHKLLLLFNLCIFGGLAGAGIFTAQFYGKDDHNGVRDTMRAKYYIALGSVALFLLVFVLFGENLISAFLHEGNEGLDLGATLGHAKDYIAVMYFQMLPFAVTQVYSSTLRETGEAMLPMKAGIAAVLVNLVFNYILIFGKFGAPALGVVGAAIATVLSRFVECAIVITWTHRHKERNRFIVGVYETMRVPPELARQIVRLGAPLLINELLWSGGMAMLNQCYSMRGLEVVSACNISSTVSNLFLCAALSMGNTVAIIVGQLLGAGELERAVDEDRKLIAFSVALSTCVGIVMALLAPLLPQLYNTSGSVKQMASDMLWVSAAMMPFNAFTNTCYFTLRSGGKTIITFIFDSAYIWAICIPVAFTLSRYTTLPILPMFMIVQSLEILKCGIGFVFVKRRKWVNNLVTDPTI